MLTGIVNDAADFSVAPESGNVGERGALHGAQGSHDVFIEPLERGEVFDLEGHFTVPQAGDVEGVVGNIPLPAIAVEGVGGWPETDVGLALPVAAVVFALAAGHGKIGYLVVLVASFAEGFGEDIEVDALAFFAYVGHLSFFYHVVQGGFCLYGKRIAGKVRNAEGNGLLNVLSPLLVAKGGRAIDEIDGEIVKPHFLRQLNAADGLPGVVGAVHPHQVFLAERLDADAEAVDAEGLPG